MSSQEYIQITKVMSENLGRAILSDSGDSSNCFRDSLNFFRDSCTNKLPAPSTVNMLIFDSLMKNCAAIKLDDVGVFLQNLLVAIPLNNPDFKYDYKTAILDQTSQFPDLWSVLDHLIKSSFSHRGILKHRLTHVPELVNYPVCDLLIHFYVEFILKFLSLKSDLFENSYYNRRREIMRWINELYKFHVEEVEILKDLHNLLDQAVNSEVMLNASCSAVALNQTSLLEAVSQLFIICKDVFASYDKFVQFLNYSKLPYLSASICYYMLYKITEAKNLPVEKPPLTLKELVRCFLFIRLPSQEEKKCAPVFSVKEAGACLKEADHEGRVKRAYIQNLPLGDTQMHKMCRSNMMGDLLKTLLTKKRQDLNKVNYAGQTPLHVACISSNFICAKFLLDPLIGKRHKQLNISAFDKQYSTPLHYAVMAGDEDIVRLILQRGGEKVLLKKDTHGLKPHDYCVSKDMTRIFRSYFPNVCFESDAYVTEQFKISTIHCKEDYLTYLYALYSLLSYYFDIFKLYNYRHNTCKVEAHDGSACSHFSSAANVICVEDYSVIHSLPKCIEELIKHVEEDALQINIDVKKQVRLLKLFSQTIPTVK